MLDLRHQKLWLLIADIADFTGLSVEMEVEKLANTMGRWLHDCHRIVEKGLGRIPKYIGDGFLACWEERSDAAPAVVAAIHDFQQLRLHSPVKFRVALHYGAVTFGEISAWGEPSMLGPEVNYVFRLEDLASKLGVGFCLSSSAEAKLASLPFPSRACPASTSSRDSMACTAASSCPMARRFPLLAADGLAQTAPHIERRIPRRCAGRAMARRSCRGAARRPWRRSRT